MFLQGIIRTVVPALLALAVLATLTLGFGMLSVSIVGNGYRSVADYANARRYPAAHPSPYDVPPLVPVRFATKGGLP